MVLSETIVRKNDFLSEQLDFMSDKQKVTGSRHVSLFAADHRTTGKAYDMQDHGGVFEAYRQE